MHRVECDVLPTLSSIENQMVRSGFSLGKRRRRVKETRTLGTRMGNAKWCNCDPCAIVRINKYET